MVTLQEVICEAGTHAESSKDWTIVTGKTATEWRGEGIAYRHAQHSHAHVECTEGMIAVVLRGGDLSDLGTEGGETRRPIQTGQQVTAIGVVSAHLPHHATAAKTEQLLGRWGESVAMVQPKAVFGGDLNESFLDFEQGVAAETGRGDIVLQWMDEQQLRLPDQELEKPTYHPYNTAMRSRRLDYVAVKKLRTDDGAVLEGTRDIIQSDHDIVVVPVHCSLPTKTSIEVKWGARILKSDDEVRAGLLQHWKGDPHTAIAAAAKAITVPAGQGGEPWQESEDLKHLRAQAKIATSEERRGKWKLVWKVRKQERRAWMQRKVLAAARMNWGELRALGKQTQNKHWEHQLTGQDGWQQQLKKHFEGTFATLPREQVRQAFDQIRHKLRGLCKQTAWVPFQEGDLVAATATWGRRKATGVDEISWEALGALQQDEVWRERLLYLFNDVLYTGKLYGGMGDGVTILLPKVALPLEWGQTRRSPSPAQPSSGSRSCSWGDAATTCNH